VQPGIVDAGHRIAAHLDLAAEDGRPEPQHHLAVDGVEAEVLERGERHCDDRSDLAS
jgi:hypothetical protein